MPNAARRMNAFMSVFSSGTCGLLFRCVDLQLEQLLVDRVRRLRDDADEIDRDRHAAASRVLVGNDQMKAVPCFVLTSSPSASARFSTAVLRFVSPGMQPSSLFFDS